VRLGSRSAAKREALRRALTRFYTDIVIEDVEVPSGVPEQPIGLEQIVAGARNRARRSFDAEGPGDCDLAAGIEDGLVPVPGAKTGYVNLGCAVLFDGRTESIGFTSGFEYPPRCVAAATASEPTPVGEAFDAIWDPPEGLADPGPGAGNIGRLTNGVLSRSDYGAQAVVCALVRRLHPSLYIEEDE
jgi:inosine/xanthosine triphosphatase